MIDAAVAEAMGIPHNEAEDLLNGLVSPAIAHAVGVPQEQVRAYIETGATSNLLAERLGVPMESAVEELGTRLSKKGRIGLIAGLLFPR
jgi:hypothetical protein